MLFGRVTRFVIRFDCVRCGRQYGEIPPAHNFRRRYGNISGNRHLDQRRCVRVKRSLDGRTDVIRCLHFGCNLEAE